MPVILDGKTYYEGTTLRRETLYRLLEDGATVSTSQPAPADVAKTWERAFLDGSDEMVYIPMSSGLSSSLQTAKLLAEDYRGVVHVVDNHRISVTQRHAVLDAVQMTQRGNTGYCIKARPEETAYLSLVYVGGAGPHLSETGRQDHHRRADHGDAAETQTAASHTG